MSIRIIEIAFHGIDELDEERLQRSRNAGGTLVVPIETDARGVALRAETENAGLILVTDEADVIRGVVLPDWVAHQVSEIMHQPATTLGEAVRVLAEDPRAPFTYGHEWLNLDRPELYWCDAGHYTHRCPCSVHEVACGPSA
jgi:hypothetical protein